jgi:hypothetical protein
LGTQVQCLLQRGTYCLLAGYEPKNNKRHGAKSSPFRLVCHIILKTSYNPFNFELKLGKVLSKIYPPINQKIFWAFVYPPDEKDFKT